MAKARLTNGSITANLNPQGQNLENVHRIVDRMLGMAGCSHCGRLSILKIDILGDPPVDLAKDGVVSIAKEGF